MDSSKFDVWTSFCPGSCNWLYGGEGLLFTQFVQQAFYFAYSFVAFAFASVLDFTDGYIARHFNQRSRLGTLIDPIADKALMVCLGISMGYVGLIHVPVAALIIGKDILMGLGFFGICWKHGFRSSNLYRFVSRTS